MKEDFYSNVLFPIVRAGLDLPAEPPADDIDFERLGSLAKQQSIAPIVRRGLMKLGIGGEGYAQIDRLCDNDVFVFAHREMAMNAICACFEKNKIRYVPLKGYVIRDLYPEKWIRTSCDIDVLVHEEEIDKAVEALERETAFRVDGKMFHDVSMRMQNVHLELHFNILENTENIDRLLSRVWDYTVVSADGCRCDMTPEFQLFHILAHMEYHFLHGGLGIRPYLDLWLFRHKVRYDEEKLRAMCEECGILKFYEECRALSEVWLAGEEHTETTEALERYSVEGGVFGTLKNKIMTGRREKRGIRYIFGRVFVSKKRLQTTYPELKKHPILLPVCQVRRWFRALKHNRSDIKTEISVIRKTSDAEIDSFDRLMKSVGL